MSPTNRPILSHGMKPIVPLFSFSKVPIAIIFAVEPITVILPPKHAPNKSAHQSVLWALATFFKLSSIGINAATTTTLSRILEVIAEPNRTVVISNILLPDTSDSSLPARIEAVPVSATMPACAKRKRPPLYVLFYVSPRALPPPDHYNGG